MIQVYAIHTRCNSDSKTHTLDSNTQKIESKRIEKIYHVNSSQKLSEMLYGYHITYT